MYVACAYHGTSGMSEDSLRSLFSLCVMCIPGTKLVSSDLAASASNLWALLPAQQKFIWRSRVMGEFGLYLPPIQDAK